MQIEKIIEIIKQGEGLEVEFKETTQKLSKDIYETVCAFLNTQGGHLILGVKDDGTILGVKAEAKEQMKRDFVTMVNNPQRINPVYYLSLKEYVIDDKIVLAMNVPRSSHVHRLNGRIYMRNEESDLDVTDNTLAVAQLYLGKLTSYSENRVFPYARFSELDHSWFPKVKALASIRNSNHPWLEMSDLEILKSAGLYRYDPNTKQEGLTLAGTLIFGNETLIRSALPHHRTDAILRVDNLERYDDRDDIRSNLLTSYRRLMAFVAKHLNDKFFVEGTVRVSVREKIFREAVANMLIHREFTNGFPAKLIIERSRVCIENANKPHGDGFIDPYDFSPFPKNPTIANFFKEIGWADELGTGVRIINRYNLIYSGASPHFIEGDIFKTIIPLISQDVSEAHFDEMDVEILEALVDNPTMIQPDMAQQLGLTQKILMRRVHRLVDADLAYKKGSMSGVQYMVQEDSAWLIRQQLRQAENLLTK